MAPAALSTSLSMRMGMHGGRCTESTANGRMSMARQGLPGMMAQMDAIRRIDGKDKKFAYHAGKSFTDEPDNVTDARNTSPRPI